MLALLARPELQSNTTIFEPNRMGRIVGLASVPNECEARDIPTHALRATHLCDAIPTRKVF